MTITNSLEELLQILKEIKRLERLERLRNLSKILLIGFFLGKNNPKHIQSLIIRANKNLNNILETNFEEINRNSLYEKPEIFQAIKKIENILKSSKSVFGSLVYTSTLNKIQLLSICLCNLSRFACLRFISRSFFLLG